MWVLAGEIKTNRRFSMEFYKIMHQCWTTFADICKSVLTYIHTCSADIGCGRGDQPGAIDGRYGWQEKLKEISAFSVT